MAQEPTHSQEAAQDKPEQPKIKSLPLKRASASYEIRKDDGRGEHSVYQHSILCQTFFPYRSQGDIDYWKRQQGRVILSVQSLKQEHPVSGETITLGIPYGPKVRLIMAFINTEILRQQNAKIEVADSMTAFIRNDLKLDTNGRTIRSVKDQLARLASSVVSISFVDEETGHLQRVDNKVVKGYDLWFPKSPDQKIFWTSTIEVTADYAESLAKHAVPLDMRAVASLANNPMALDIYAWLSYRLHWIDRRKPLFVPWASLYQQFGSNYAKIRQFRSAFLKNLKEVMLVYPDAKVERADHKDGNPGGLLLHNSPPAIRKKQILTPDFRKLNAGNKKG